MVLYFTALSVWLYRMFDVFSNCRVTCISMSQWWSCNWSQQSRVFDQTSCCSSVFLIKLKQALITCSLLLWPPADLIFSCGVCVERATHPLHNNDGFCLHLPVFLLSASPAELQLFQCQPWRQRGALPHWHGEDDQVQDLPGLPALLPPHLQLHPLPGAPGQPRRAHFKGTAATFAA